MRCPVDFSKILSATRTIPVPYGEESVSVTYKPSAFGDDYYTWLREQGNEEGSLFAKLARALVSWEIAANGVTLPPTPEVMRGEHPAMRPPAVKGEELPPLVPIPTPFLRAVESCIDRDMDAVRLGKTTSATLPSS